MSVTDDFERACAIIAWIMHVPFPEELDDEQWSKLWARTKWLLKNNFIDNLKWDEKALIPADPEEEEEQEDA